jgi:hypothetical protein
LTVTLTLGASGGTAPGASVLFTTSGDSLTNVQVGSEQVFTGTKVIAVTNSSDVATGDGGRAYGLGHPAIIPFSETAN